MLLCALLAQTWNVSFIISAEFQIIYQKNASNPVLRPDLFLKIPFNLCFTGRKD